MLFYFIFAFIVFVVFLCFLWSSHHFNYWQRSGVCHIPVTPFLGNVRNLLLYRCCFGDQFKQLYNYASIKNAPVVGIHVLHNHALLLREPELIKRILVKDFSAFSNRFETTDPIGDSMGSLNLFFAKYEIWRDIHNLFAPLFAHGRIKQMYPLLQHIGLKLQCHLSQLKFDTSSNATITEVKELCALFTTDTIASIAFGINANSLENPKAEFRQMCIEVNTPRPKRIFHLFIMFFFPQLAKTIGTHLYSNKYEQFMRKSINYVIAEREQSGIKRGDLIDVFINLKRHESAMVTHIINKPDFFVAQAAFLLLAGFDTSSSTMTFALYELAKNEQIQKRLRAEIQQTLLRDGGSISYESINEMEYLRMVVDEILRLYPPTSFLDRCCTAPNGYDMQPWSAFRIPKGMPVYISVLGLHRDEKYWPEPNKFKPERFSVENRKTHKPMSYLPFGSGPRGCIGTLLGLLEVKVGLVHILSEYYVKFCKRTPKKIKFDEKTFVLAPKGGIYLQFVKNPVHKLKTDGKYTTNKTIILNKTT